MELHKHSQGSGIAKPQSSWLCKSNSFRLPERLQIDSSSDTFIEMAAFQSQRARNIGHVEIVAANFCEHHFPSTIPYALPTFPLNFGGEANEPLDEESEVGE